MSKTHHISTLMVHFKYTDIFVTTTFLLKTNMVVVSRVDCISKISKILVECTHLTILQFTSCFERYIYNFKIQMFKYRLRKTFLQLTLIALDSASLELDQYSH